MSLSVKFNGIELNTYIDVLQGFTAFSGPKWDPETTSVGRIMRGEDFKYTTYKTKTIPMPFTISGDIKSKYDMLQRILNVDEPKELVFGNATDRVFYAVPMNDLDFDDWECLGEGTITWLIPDGLAHSVVEKTFTAVKNSSGVLETTIVNNGTESVPIDYTITHKSENGFIGIVTKDGVIQLGDAGEQDGETRQKTQQLINYRTPEAYSAMTDGQGILGFNYIKNGTFKIVGPYEGHKWLALDNIGSGAGTWHGASKMVTIPADSGGVVGAQNFYVQAKVWFETGTIAQTGMLMLSIGDTAGNHLASIRVAKYELGKNLAYAMFDVEGVEKQRVSFIPDYKGCTTHDKGHIYIKKSGQKFQFYFGGGVYTLYGSAASKTKQAKYISIFSGQHGTMSKNALVTRMYWDYLFFRKDNVNYWYDIPNRYQSGDVVYINGKDTKVYTNGVISQEDEIVGSNYPKAPPGETKVQFFYSDFADPAPTITAKIREAYL
ncbi:Phage-related protein [[Eubacterium] contortum]|uniref:Phage-related protein n=1 Tax=Faecalicatena contorta TaxID=39482 RepID=A0A174L9P7_9FIRM|nr:distal tail protein Dit [Faecalicatena contorta]CUP20863.1 Phage-related protein [[Eubacterium] contortum] [Faecalicatena contorta]